MDNQSTICHGSSIQAFQNVGHPVMTLGEVKNRADVVVYVGTMNLFSRHIIIDGIPGVVDDNQIGGFPCVKVSEF